MLTTFERQIVNAMAILVRQNGGEIHGDMLLLADRIACEIGFTESTEIVQKMQTKLQEIGLETLTANSPVVFFRSITGELNLVDRELVENV
jgi:hypothetical protein